MSETRGRARAWAPWGANVRFAERIASRHARVASWRDVAGRVMARAARGVGRITARHEWRVVRLELRVRVDGRGADSNARRPMVVAWGPPPLSMYDRSSSSSSSIRRDDERRLASLDRIERVAVARSTSPAASASPYARPFPAVPRVLRRGAPNDVPTDVDARDVAARRAARLAPSTRMSLGAPGAPFSAFTPPELDRLTTQVVDAIDRRLAAYRERHGRV